MSIITISTADIKITGIGSINNKDEALELLNKSEDQLSYATYIGNDDTNAIVVEFLDNSLKDLNNIAKTSIIEAKTKTIIEVKKLLDTSITSASASASTTETTVNEDETEHNVISYPRNYNTYSKVDYSYGCFRLKKVDKPHLESLKTHVVRQSYDNIKPENMVGMVIAVEEPGAKERRNDNIPKPVLALVVSYFYSKKHVKSDINKELKLSDGPRIGIIYFDDIKDFYKKLKIMYLESLNDKFTTRQAVDQVTIELIKKMIEKDNSLIKEGIEKGIKKLYNDNEDKSKLKKILRTAVVDWLGPITLKCIFDLCDENTFGKCFTSLLKSFTDEKLINFLSNKFIKYLFNLKTSREDDINQICNLLRIDPDNLDELKSSTSDVLYVPQNNQSADVGDTDQDQKVELTITTPIELENIRINIDKIFDILYPSAKKIDFQTFIDDLEQFNTDFASADINIDKVDDFFTMVHTLNIADGSNKDNILSLTNFVKEVINRIGDNYFDNKKDDNKKEDIIKAITTVIKANILLDDNDDLLKEMIITNAIDFHEISITELSNDEMKCFECNPPPNDDVEKQYSFSCHKNIKTNGYNSNKWNEYTLIVKKELGKTRQGLQFQENAVAANSAELDNKIENLKETFQFLNVDNMLKLLKGDIGKFAIVDPVTVIKDGKEFKTALPWTYLGSPHIKSPAPPKKSYTRVMSSEIHKNFHNEIKKIPTEQIHFKHILDVMDEPNQNYLSQMLISCFFEFLLRVKLWNDHQITLSCDKTTMNQVRSLGFGDITGDEWQPKDDSEYGIKKGGGDLQPEINKSNKKTKKNIREK